MFVDGAFVPELSDLRRSMPGVTHLLAGSELRAATAGRADASPCKVEPADDPRVALNTAFVARRRGDPRGARSRASTSRSIWCSSTAATDATAVFARSLVVVEQGAQVDADREP